MPFLGKEKVRKIFGERERTGDIKKAGQTELIKREFSCLIDF